MLIYNCNVKFWQDVQGNPCNEQIHFTPDLSHGNDYYPKFSKTLSTAGWCMIKFRIQKYMVLDFLLPCPSDSDYDRNIY